jgi:Fe-S-cluster-containing hydrogenase component 2
VVFALRCAQVAIKLVEEKPVIDKERCFIGDKCVFVCPGCFED